MTTVRLTPEEERLFKKYADFHNISVSQLIREAVIEKIEDEYDLEVYEKALKEFKNNPEKYDLDEVEKELGI